MDIVYTPWLPPSTEKIVQSYLSHFSVPHLLSSSRSSSSSSSAFRLLPPIGNAVVDLVRYLQWSHTRILYEFDQGQSVSQVILPPIYQYPYYTLYST